MSVYDDFNQCIGNFVWVLEKDGSCDWLEERRTRAHWQQMTVQLID